MFEPRSAPQATFHLAFFKIAEVERPNDGLVYHLRHTSGLEVVVHKTLDPNKVFCIGFPTPNNSNNGLTHILEHMVLSGSKDFPLQSPYFSKAEGAYSTVLEAQTAHDCTYYHGASISSDELQNLATVILDSVFNPLLSEEAFQREAWRYEPAPNGAPMVQGVVYNEMKGGLSDPSTILFTSLCAALFPDTEGGKISGGHPDEIPNLTIEMLKQYHAEHYVPSRARIVLHGNFTNEELSNLLAAIDSNTPAQALATTDPRPQLTTLQAPCGEHTSTFSVEPGAGSPPPLAAVGWRLPVSTDLKGIAMWELLTSILSQGDNAPLGNGLIKTGIAASIIDKGSDFDRYQPFFRVRASGVTARSPAEFRECVKEVLAKRLEAEIPPEQLATSIQRLKLFYTAGTPELPEGLRWARNALSESLHGRTSSFTTDYSAVLDNLKGELSILPERLKDLIRKYLVDSDEVAAVMVVPREQAPQEVQDKKGNVSPDVPSAQDATISSTNDGPREGCSNEQTESLVSSLPWLPRTKLPTTFLDSVRPTNEGSAEPLFLEANTKGVTYAHVAFDISDLGRDSLAYAPILATLMSLGDSSDSVAADKLREGLHRFTSGLVGDVLEATDRRSLQPRSALCLSSCSLGGSIGEMLPLMQTAAHVAALPGDRNDFRGLVRNMLEAHRGLLSREGFRIALAEAATAASARTQPCALFRGYEQMRFLQRLQQRIDSDWAGVRADIDGLLVAVKTRVPLWSFCADPQDITRVRYAAEAVAQHRRHPSQVTVGQDIPPRQSQDPKQLGLLANADVAYIATAAALPTQATEELAGALLVAARALTYRRLLPEVRIKRNAYYTAAQYDPSTRLFTTFVHRSKFECMPKDLKTLREAPAWLTQNGLSVEQFDRLVVGTAGAFMRWQHPRQAIQRHSQKLLGGDVVSTQEAVYQQIRGCTRDQFAEAVKLLAEYASDPFVRMVAPRDALTRAGIQGILSLDG